MQGSDGDDRLSGDSGNDFISAGSGNDFIRGGTGVDRIVGGAGTDTFHFLEGEAKFDLGRLVEDEINDFSGIGQEGDAIDLSDVFDGTLVFRPSGFTGAAGEVRIVDYRGGAGNDYRQVQVNLDEDANTVEMAILVDVEGNFDLQASGFIM